MRPRGLGLVKNKTAEVPLANDFVSESSSESGVGTRDEAIIEQSDMPILRFSPKS